MHKVQARARKVRKTKALSQRFTNIDTILKIFGWYALQGAQRKIVPHFRGLESEKDQSAPLLENVEDGARNQARIRNGQQKMNRFRPRPQPVKKARIADTVCPIFMGADNPDISVACLTGVKPGFAFDD